MENIFNKAENLYINHLNRFMINVVELGSSTLSRNVFINDDEYRIIFNYLGNIESSSTSFFALGNLEVLDETNKRKILLQSKDFAYDLDSDGNELKIQYFKNGDLINFKESNNILSNTKPGAEIFTDEELGEISNVIDDILNKKFSKGKKRTLQSKQLMI